jgi:hypothetical protein
MLFLAAALFGLSYIYGLNRGMDRMVSGPLDTRAQQIASALSDVAYNLDLRHAVHWTVLKALTKGGLSDVPDNFAPLGFKYPEYLYNAPYWNNLLNEVTQLKGITDKPPSVSDGTLTFVQSEDLGIVDYYKLSFRLFGYNVQGFFKTYFLLLAFGLVPLFVAFWSRPGILVAANLLLFGLLLAICQISEVASVANGRFFATLAIFPIFHLMLLIWRVPRLTTILAITATTQVLLFAVVITMRSSAVWGVLLIAASVGVTMTWQAWKLWSDMPLKVFVQRSLTWPTAVIVLGLIGHNVWHDGRIHSGYFALDETLPHHLVWHPLAVSLGDFYDIDKRAPGLEGQRGDALPTYLGNAYLKKAMGLNIPPEQLTAYYPTNYFPHLGRTRTYERLVRAAYLDFIRQYPVEFLYFTFVTKPQSMLSQLQTMWSRVLATSGSYFFVATLLVVVATGFISPTARHKADLNLGAMAIGAMAIGCILPSIVAFPANLGETFAIWVAFVPAVLLMFGWGSWRGLKYFPR